MSEIKSTLALVMERTRGIKMTEQEKAEQRARELAEKIRVLLHKYVTDFLSLKWLQSEFDKLAALSASGPKAKEVFKMEILGRIDPEGENDRLYEVLEGVLGLRKGPYLKVVDRFRAELAADREKSVLQATTRLARLGISGSAVFPNLEQDEAWQTLISSKKSDFRNKLKSVQDK